MDSLASSNHGRSTRPVLQLLAIATKISLWHLIPVNMYCHNICQYKEGGNAWNLSFSYTNREINRYCTKGKIAIENTA